MRFFPLALMGLILLGCSSSGEPSVPTTTALPALTSTPTIEDVLAAAYPNAVNLSGTIGQMREAIRQVFAHPQFDADRLCRSLQGLSDSAAWQVWTQTFKNYGWGQPESRGPYLNAAMIRLLREECARMYP
jgi:hypothetical protein